MLADVALMDSDAVRAEELARQSLGTRQSVGDEWGYVLGLIVIARAATKCEDFKRAAHLFGAAEHARERLNITFAFPPYWHAEYERAVAHTQTALGAARFADLFNSGCSANLDDVVAEEIARLVPERRARLDPQS